MAKNTKIRINYEDIKKLNSKMGVWNKKENKPKIFIDLQNEIKNLPKNLRKYNRKTNTYELRKDRNLSEKNLYLLKEMLNSANETLPNFSEVRKLLHKETYTKKDKDGKKITVESKFKNYSYDTLIKAINHVKSNYNNKIGTDIIGAYWLARRKYDDIDDDKIGEKMTELLNYYDKEEKHFDMELLNHDLFNPEFWQEL